MYKKINIAYPFSGKSFGGAQKSIFDLIENVNKNKFNCIVILHKKNILIENYLKKKNISYIFFPIKELAGSNPRFFIIFFLILKNFFKINYFIKENKIDIVHSNNLDTNLSWGFICNFINVPFIWHQRTIVSKSLLWNFLIIFKYIISTSRTIKKSLPNKVRNKAFIIKNFFKFPQKKNLSKSKKIINILIAGRIVETKQIDFIINSIKNNKRLFFYKERFRLYIIGKGNKNYVDNLKNIVKNTFLTKIIYFKNFSLKIEKHISRSDIIIAPGLNEGFGRTLLEGMIYGKLIIASKSGAHKEIIKNNHNGFLYNPLDPNKFVNLLLYVMKNVNSLNNIKKKAQNYAYKNFDKDKITMKYEKICKIIFKKQKQ